ncbi:MAG: ABC transporter permease, partial [Acidimicrobiia bacterium]
MSDRRRIIRSRLSFRDLVTEAVAGMLARPGRTVLTILGTVLGVAALVATLGLAKTAGNQIVTRFDALAATSITVSNRTDSFFRSPGLNDVSAIPWDAEDRLTRLNGVVAAGTLSLVDTGGQLVSSVPINDPLGQSEFAMDVLAASPGLFDAVISELRTGRFFDIGHDERGDPVAVLGPGAAARLNINRVDQQPAIFVGDTTLAVIGIIEDVATEPSLLDAIIVPNGTARSLFGTGAPAEVHIRTEIGAAYLIGDQAPIALNPNDPSLLRVQVPPEPRAVRSGVESDVNTLFLVLGGVSLLVGAIGIANVTLVSVLERVGEIGLRRAVGAARRHIASQFLVESAAMGFIGGIIGASAGVLVIVAVSANKQWTP